MFFDSRIDVPGASEVYDLSVEDIEAFKTAEGELLGYKIKHLRAAEFAEYLRKVGDDSVQVLDLNEQAEVRKLRGQLNWEG